MIICIFLLSLLIEFDYEAMASSSAEEDDAGLLKFRCICVFERVCYTNVYFNISFSSRFQWNRTA